METKYSLKKRVLATLEIFNETGAFRPHVNVVIFEDGKKRLAIPKKQLERIKTSYRRALEKSLQEKIANVDVYCKYHDGKSET